MGDHGIRDRVAIVGMGCTRFGEHWDRSVDDLLVDAAGEAVASAGISLDAVDAFWLGTMVSGISGLALSRPLQLAYKPVTRVENFCATGSEAFRNACYAVASGAYDVAMAIGGEKLKDGGHSGLAIQGGVMSPDDGARVESTTPAMFSRIVPVYARRYGVSEADLREVLTRIAWKNHRNGSLNPRAHFRREVPREAIEAAPVVADPLTVLDCSGISDGAAAAIVVRAEDAHRYTDHPLYVKALSFVAGPGSVKDPSFDYTSMPEVVRSAEDAYEQAGVGDPRAELAMAEVHDCFTPTELLLMEDLGFSERGSAWKDVLDGIFDLDGPLPVNTDGGLKSFGHPIGASGLRMLLECWLQLRGEAGPRQVDNGRKLALTQNLGGPIGECVSFVSIVGIEPS
jgi:acetyl-CoA C-acetyltransferase